MQATVSLKVLGGFGLCIEGKPAPPMPLKTRALLGVLAMQPRPATREAIGELLWPGRGSQQVAHSLSEALYQLRRPLRDHALVVARDRSLMLAESVATDIGDFRRHAESSDIESLQRAADAYRGRLLDGFPPVVEDFDSWLHLTRAEIQAAVLRVLGRIGDRCTEAGDTARALEIAERMFAIDRLNEDTHRRLLEACANAGRRADAMRHYAAIVAALRQELDASPSAPTRALVERLRREMNPPPPTASPATQPVLGATRPPSLAVLPFSQLGTEEIPSHLADGITVDVVCQLAGLSELQVISHGSSLGYRDPRTDLRQVGRELGVRYVVRGTMRRQGQALRLTTELVDAETGIVVSARAHDTHAHLRFADQDRVVAEIVNTLAPRVHEQELRRIRGRRPESLSVYEKVLLAREHLLTLQRDTMDQARTLLRDVIASEPGYGEAHALMADCQAMAMTQGWLPDRTGVVAEVAALTRTALALDANNCRALMFHAHRCSLLHRDYDRAQREFARALSLWPHSALTWSWSSLTWAYIGEVAEAVRRVHRAVELSPRDRESHHFDSALCVAHYLGDDHAAAAAAGLRAIENPACVTATFRWTAGALAAAGELTRAREVARRAMVRGPGISIGDVVANSPIRDPQRRLQYGSHLAAAGFAP